MKTIENIRRFRLSDSFIEPYTTAEVLGVRSVT